MEKILFINACVRPQSRTYELAQSVLGQLQGEIEEIRLIDAELPHLTNELIELRDELMATGNVEHPLLRYARQFAEADTLVIAAPYWDLIFPATVRAYFEQVCITGLSFRYSPEGFPISLCKAKRMIYVTTAGGPIFDGFNFGYDYCKALCEGYFGVRDCLCVKAEGLDIDGADVDAIMKEAKEHALKII